MGLEWMLTTCGEELLIDCMNDYRRAGLDRSDHYTGGCLMASRKRTYKTVQVCVSPERHAELKAIADGEGHCSEQARWRPDLRGLAIQKEGPSKNVMTLSRTKSARFSRSIKPCRNRIDGAG